MGGNWGGHNLPAGRYRCLQAGRGKGRAVHATHCEASTYHIALVQAWQAASWRGSAANEPTVTSPPQAYSYITITSLQLHHRLLARKRRHKPTVASPLQAYSYITTTSLQLHLHHHHKPTVTSRLLAGKRRAARHKPLQLHQQPTAGRQAASWLEETRLPLSACSWQAASCLKEARAVDHQPAWGEHGRCYNTLVKAGRAAKEV